jgi:hypothetical protein
MRPLGTRPRCLADPTVWEVDLGTHARI